MVDVQTNGVRLHVQDLGEGPAVVLISGFGLDHRLWDRQVRVLLENGLRVICVDQRGHGLSDKPVGGYDIETLAADLEAVLNDRGVVSATVVGHSFGGQVAFQLAAKTPGLVGRLVLVGSNGVRASRSAEFAFGRPPEATVATLTGHERENRIESRVMTITSGFAADPDPRLLDHLVTMSLQMPSWAAVACYESMLLSDLLADVPAITQPVLQVIGAADPVHSAKGARWLSAQLADTRLVEIEACGHYPMLEAPEAFEGALLSFIEARGRDRGAKS